MDGARRLGGGDGRDGGERGDAGQRRAEGRGLGQGGAEGDRERGLDGGDERGAVAEAHLPLRGVDVHVDERGGQVDEEQDDGFGVARGPGLADGVLDLGRGGGAAVDEDVLLGGAGTGEVGLGDVAGEADGALGVVDGEEGVGDGLAEKGAGAVGQGVALGQGQRVAPVDAETEGDGGIGEGDGGERLADARELGGRGGTCGGRGR